LEARTIDQVCRFAQPGITLAKAQEWFKTLKVHDPARQEILRTPSEPVERMSMMSRYLRGSFTLEAVARQAEIFGARMAQLLRPDTPVAELKASLPDDRLVERIARTTAAIRAAPRPKTRLASTPPHLKDDLLGPLSYLCGQPDEGSQLIVRPDGDMDLGVRVVLVIDQLEQLFTHSRSDTCARALRMLADLLTAQALVHVVLSLRKEWYVDLVKQLSQHLRMNEPWDRTTFYLEPMSQSEAEEVMKEAPRQVGALEIRPEQRHELWRLLETDGTIDAVILSIACHELFAIGEAAQSTINEAGVEGMLRAYLSRALDQFVIPAERDEALDILGEVAGAGSTRSFITQTRLLGAPLRDPARRRKVLDGLQKAFLVKGDSPRPNLDKVFDIMHERLVSPVRQMVEARPEISEFREATERVTQPEASERGLSWPQCRILLIERDRISWEARAAGIVLSSLLRQVSAERLSELQQATDGLGASPPGGSKENRDWLRERLRELAHICMQPPPEIVSVADRLRLSWWMTAAEILGRLQGPRDVAADELALKSGIQGPPDWLSQELAALAVRFEQPATGRLNSHREV
jgi:hypothetical protein